MTQIKIVMSVGIAVILQVSMLVICDHVAGAAGKWSACV